MAGRATQHKGCGFQVIRSLGCVEGISNGTAYQSGAKKNKQLMSHASKTSPLEIKLEKCDNRKNVKHLRSKLLGQ